MNEENIKNIFLQNHLKVMKKFLLVCFSFFAITICTAQNFTGQWKGGFIDKSTSMFSWGGDRCDYVLDIEVTGTKVTGYSYTYFTDGGKKYYTICRLEGKADAKKKYLEVTETARTKTNVPSNISNSFQLHKLTWRKEAGNEILEGTWLAAPGQDKTNTGYGTTVLSKRQLTEISPLAKKMNGKNSMKGSPERPVDALVSEKNKTVPLKNVATKKTDKPNNQNTVIASTKKTNPAIAKSTITTKQLIKKPIIVAKKDTTTKQTIAAKIILPTEKIVPVVFEKRNNIVLQTVVVENANVKVELYDNGDVDGDSVSLFYNSKVLLAHKKLTEQAITIELPVNNEEVNELVMYADNLGTIPPNTALMIVTDGSKRYEVRITSDLKKSGTIRFVHKKNATP